MDEDNRVLLEMHLEAYVPLRIADLSRRGGPQDADFDRLRGYLEPRDAVTQDGTGGRDSLLCAGAEALMFRTEPGQSAAWVSKLVDALAVLSFRPGGVWFLGRRWQSSRHNGT